MQAVTIHPVGDPVSQKWRDDILSRHFPLRSELMANYRQVAEHQSYQEANGQLRRIDQRLMRADLNLSWDLYKDKTPLGDSRDIHGGE